jgi:hypothetical protein
VAEGALRTLAGKSSGPCATAILHARTLLDRRRAVLERTRVDSIASARAGAKSSHQLEALERPTGRLSHGLQRSTPTEVAKSTAARPEKYCASTEHHAEHDPTPRLRCSAFLPPAPLVPTREVHSAGIVTVRTRRESPRLRARWFTGLRILGASPAGSLRLEFDSARIAHSTLRPRQPAFVLG